MRRASRALLNSTRREHLLLLHWRCHARTSHLTVVIHVATYHHATGVALDVMVNTRRKVLVLKSVELGIATRV